MVVIVMAYIPYSIYIYIHICISYSVVAAASVGSNPEIWRGRVGAAWDGNPETHKANLNPKP